MSKVEEINTIEKIEGDKIYEVMYIMGQELLSMCRSMDSSVADRVSRLF